MEVERDRVSRIILDDGTLIEGDRAHGSQSPTRHSAVVRIE